MMTNKFKRALFLVLVIVSAVVCIFCGYMAWRVTHSVIAYFLLPIGVLIWVLGLEIFSVIATKKTLSTNVTKALEDYKKARIWIYLELFFLVLVLLFLAPHLFITGM